MTGGGVLRRVVVVGGTGQIGRPLCAALAGAGDAVTVFSRDPARAAALVPAAAHCLAWSPRGLRAGRRERRGGR